jgi:hypothetical protein
MNLQSSIELYRPAIVGGGEGSGCNPEAAGQHGEKCGRPAGAGVDVLMEKTGGQLGSNPGGTYKGSDGVERYVKFYKDPSQAQCEMLANKIYREVGLEAPRSRTGSTEGYPLPLGTYVANDKIAGMVLKETNLTQERAQEILKGFAADVLTANWDAVGLEHDNILVHPDGGVTRIDQGGTFLFRAKMGRKPEAALVTVSEPEKLLDPKVNPAYAKIAKAAGISSVEDLKQMEHEGLETQVNRILSLRNSQAGGWKEFVEKEAPGLEGKDKKLVVDALNARTNALEALIKLPSLKPEALAEQKPVPEVTTFTKENPEGVASKSLKAGTNIAGIYKVLSDGEWHKQEDLAKAIGVSKVSSSGWAMTSLKKLGKTSGEWTIEKSSGAESAQYRLVRGKPLSEAQEKKQDQGVDAARPYAQKIWDLQETAEAYGYYSHHYSDPAQAVVNDYLKAAGISDEKRLSYFDDLNNWTMSANKPSSRVMRAVAQEHYGRPWKGAEFQGSTPLQYRPQQADVDAARPAMMAMKHLCQAYCELEGTRTIYRGIDTSIEMRSEIRKARAAGVSQEVDIGFNSLASWSVKRLDWNNTSLKTKVASDNVWAYYRVTPWSFINHTSENEIVVGHRSPKEKYSDKDIKLKKVGGGGWEK